MTKLEAIGRLLLLFVPPIIYMLPLAIFSLLVSGFSRPIGAALRKTRWVIAYTKYRIKTRGVDRAKTREAQQAAAEAVGGGPWVLKYKHKISVHPVAISHVDGHRYCDAKLYLGGYISGYSSKLDRGASAALRAASEVELVRHG